jgi:hypothetical protein
VQIVQSMLSAFGKHVEQKILGGVLVGLNLEPLISSSQIVQVYVQVGFSVGPLWFRTTITPETARHQVEHHRIPFV